MDAEQQVFWHYLGNELAPIMDTHVADVREKHGDDWVRHIDPWTLVLPCMEKTIDLVRTWDALLPERRDELTKIVLDHNAAMRELIAPGVEDALAGRVVDGDTFIARMEEHIASLYKDECEFGCWLKKPNEPKHEGPCEVSPTLRPST